MDRAGGGDGSTVHAGLCETCLYRKWIRSDRGSVFVLCLAHKTHPEMPKYPVLPILRCGMYLEQGEFVS